MSTEQEQKTAIDMIKAVHDDGVATINGRDYQFSSTTHKKRRKVFAYYSKIGSVAANGDMSFIDTPEWDAIETMICEMTLFDGMQLSKLDGHWDKYPQDYIMFATISMQVISYPFMQGNAGV